MSWRERVDWSRHGAEFGALRTMQEESTGQPFVAMEFAPPGHDEVAVTDRLWEIWLSLPLHPNILEPVRADRGMLMLRYAAIDWTRRAADIDRDDVAATVATWGVELTRAFEFLTVCMPAGEQAWIACPIAAIDIEGNIRLAFASPGGNVALMNRLAPEVHGTWPACNERSLVYAVGQVLLGLVKVGSATATTPLGSVIQKCLAAKPQQRYRTLEELRGALVEAGGQRNRTRSFDADHIWSAVEDAIGFLAKDDALSAVAQIADVVDRYPTSGLARRYAEDLQEVTGLSIGSDERVALARGRRVQFALPAFHRTTTLGVNAVPREPDRTLRWEDVAAQGLQLQHERRFAEALDLYSRVRIEDNPKPLYVAIARCCLEAGEYGPAIDYARRVQQHDAKGTIGLELESMAWLRKKQFREALEVAGRWLAIAPDSARAHHTAGKALFGLRRLSEAREELDHACALEPQLLVAMLLRREVDRLTKHVRGVVGTASAQTVDLPAHLIELREVLIAGRTSEAIAILSRAEYDSDVDAQLLLGQLQTYAGRHEAALMTYERIAGDRDGDAAVGAGGALLALQRFADALERFDRVLAKHPERVDALLGRSHALRCLGRGAEADAAYKQALAASAQRSDARVRLAGR